MKIIKLRFYTLVFFLFFSSGHAFSQISVTGTVSDSAGNPIAHATVLVKNTKVGTQTSSDGTFTLTAPSGATTLEISSIGYETHEVPIGNGNVSVTLQTSSTELANITIVSIGYGALDKKEVSSAITHLSADDLTKVASNNALMSIQGKVAGLSVTNTASADPNSSPSIQLRGVSSRDAGLGPLYVINGIPGGNLDNINQNDIESIDVLKGGAASAIYGTRGSNGVILITTKKGTSTPHTFYEGYASFDYPTNQLKVLSRDEFLKNERGIDHKGNTNWMDVVKRDPSFSQKHTLQFSGGSSKTNYFASLDYRNAEGIDLRSSKEEYGARINLNHTSDNNLYAITFNVAPRYAKTNTADYSGFNYALTLNPTIPLYDSTGKYNYITTGFFANNPVEAAKTVLDKQEIKELDISGSFKLNILKNLNTVATIGQVHRAFRGLFFIPSTNTTVINGTGRNRGSQKLDENDQKSFEWTGNYSLNVGKNSFKLLAGYSYQQFMASGFNASNEDFPSDVLTFNNIGQDYGTLKKVSMA